MQAKSQVSWSFSSIIPSRQTSLQAQITQEIEDSQRFSYIPAKIKYYKKKASEWYTAAFWVQSWQWWGVRGWWHLKQRGLYQKVSKTATKALFSGLVKKLPWEREYLGACISNLASLKTCHRLPQGQPRKTNSNIYPCQYSLTNS